MIVMKGVVGRTMSLLVSVSASARGLASMETRLAIRVVSEVIVFGGTWVSRADLKVDVSGNTVCCV